MKQKIINQVIQEMIPFLNNAQAEKLKDVLEYSLYSVDISERDILVAEKDNNYVELFLSAKRIEGCSEKSLKYYQATICTMLETVNKEVKQIVTDDLRAYLTQYQIENQSSRVTIDNIRRILSSFFSWLEDEDYIIKSPVRRIHKLRQPKA